MILLLFEFFLLLLLVFLTFNLIFLLYSFLKGSPFVGTKKKNVEVICRELKEFCTEHKIKRFIDLGSGDGRLVLTVSKKLGVVGIGYEINPILCLFSKIKAKFYSGRAKFFCRSYEKFQPKAKDLVYLYHLPGLLRKISQDLKRKNKGDFFVLSHEFKIKEKGFKLIHEIKTFPYKSYLYQV